eukprot:573519-Hanusia_phi.AAC.2
MPPVVGTDWPRAVSVQESPPHPEDRLLLLMLSLSLRLHGGRGGKPSLPLRLAGLARFILRVICWQLEPAEWTTESRKP